MPADRRRFLASVATRLLAPALAGMTLAACSAIAPPADLKAPSLGFQSLGIKELGLSQIVFTATLSADNPNSYTLPLSDTRLELFLLGERVATGTTPGGKIELPGQRSTSVPLEFTVSTTQVLGLVRQLGKGNWAQLSYQLKGDAKWGVLGLPVSFERKGDLDALRKLQDMIR